MKAENKEPAEVDYPWLGHPRRYSAVAMPNGDARWGVEGQLVLVTEVRGAAIDRQRVLSRAEAEQLRDALTAALRTFAVGAELARPVTARGPYPFRNHPTLAEV